MRKLLTGMMILGALATAGTSQAANGTVDLSWDVCSPPVTDKTTTAPGTYMMVASELGNDMFTTGYQIRAIYGDDTQNVPDAWRFDAAGCQGTGFVTLNHLPPAALSKVCPPFQQTAASLQIKDVAFTPPTDPYSVNTMRIVLANAYPSGVTANPATRYFLISAIFDHTFSVVGAGTPGSTCGGFEKSICIKLSVAEFIDSNGAAQNFGRGNSVLTFNGAAACPAIPTRQQTWGQIKGQYRQ